MKTICVLLIIALLMQDFDTQQLRPRGRPDRSPAVIREKDDETTK